MERLERKIFKTFVFVADDEDDVINADDMSSLSDVFDDDDEKNDGLSDDEVNESIPVPSVLPMSIDDIPFDREVKWINVPNSSRPKASIISGNSRLLKQIHGIASSNAIDTNSLNNIKNRDVEKRLFEVPTSATTHGGDRRPKREPRPKSVKGRGKDKEEGQESKRVERSSKRGKEPYHKRNQSAEHFTSEKHNSEVALYVEDEPKSDLTSRRQAQPGEVKQSQPPRKTEPLTSNTLQHSGQNGYHVMGVCDEEARRHPQRGRNSAVSDRQRMDVPQQYKKQCTPTQPRSDSQPQLHLAPDFDQGRRLDNAPVQGDGRTRQYYAPNQGDARYDQHYGYDYGNSWEGSEGYYGEALDEDCTAGYHASQSLSGEFDGRFTDMYGGHRAQHHHQYLSAHDRFSQNNHTRHNYYTPPHSSYSQRSVIPASSQKVPLFVPPVCETSTANLNPMAFEFVPSFAPPH